MTDRGTKRYAGIRAAVVGTGLIGGSVLLRLAESGLDVAGWDPDLATREQARARGVAAPDTLEQAVADRDVVFLGGPLPTLPRTLARVAAATAPGCVLTDVGSTKVEVAEAADRLGLTDRFVPGHPMAGAESAGLAAASTTLLAGAAWVLCPAPGAATAGFRWLTGLLVELFDARVVPMSAPAHDSAAALASHVPHLLAGALAGAAQRAPLRDAVLALAAGSFRDGTRVAGTPAERTANMLLGNRARVLHELADVTEFLDGLAAALRAGDAAALTARYAEAAAVRSALLDRRYAERDREFPAEGDHAAEVTWLRELGDAGGHLTGCRVDTGSVAYTAWLPVTD
ncbi:prephenate dehydrogenase/arogenate dehydrogenase family protein [Micromonospora acroterricola]|uniref:Prephenate dehydrogenase/arogenate dehydrogenase family protein n=1 Tax=Micromonospora acroterricola TaxID=2202421 RepID=A0A317CVG1_9ACTN|nr:prephenate dehydrogenase/arogenate dehydrogenase family protein [Micromonospora acroterricola]PWR06094.1 prephenate dehydrogenase/arogenate dehydrogenase family protein [Micromonospora acroterricola]